MAFLDPYIEACRQRAAFYEVKMTHIWEVSAIQPKGGSGSIVGDSLVLVQVVETLDQPSGTTVTVDCSSLDTFNDVKVKLSDKLGVPVENHYRLLYAGLQFENEKMLFEYNIQRESTMHLVIPLRGC